MPGQRRLQAGNHSSWQSANYPSDLPAHPIPGRSAPTRRLALPTHLAPADEPNRYAVSMPRLRARMDGWACPLETPAHAAAALNRLEHFDRETWPRILGAAAGFGLVDQAEARAMLGLECAFGSCKACGCSVIITCPDCGADACAKCWTCSTDGCGPDVLEMRLP